MPFLQTNGITTYYTVAGEGRPVVLIHNDALSHEVWSRLLPHLQPDWRVILYDRRGHGRSEVPPPELPYTVEVLAEDLRTLLDALDVGTARLFGCSGGASVALAFALAHPSRAERVILAEPPILGLRRHHPIDTAGLTGDTMAKVLREDGLEAGLAYWFRAILPPAKAAALLRGRQRALLLSRPAWLLEAILRAAEAFDPMALLPTLIRPVLLVQGECSHPTFGDVLDVLERHLPAARRLTLPGVDHAGLLHPSQALLSAVGAFLAGKTER